MTLENILFNHLLAKINKEPLSNNVVQYLTEEIQADKILYEESTKLSEASKTQLTNLLVNKWSRSYRFVVNMDEYSYTPIEYVAKAKNISGLENLLFFIDNKLLTLRTLQPASFLLNLLEIQTENPHTTLLLDFMNLFNEEMQKNTLIIALHDNRWSTIPSIISILDKKIVATTVLDYYINQFSSSKLQNARTLFSKKRQAASLALGELRKDNPDTLTILNAFKNSVTSDFNATTDPLLNNILITLELQPPVTERSSLLSVSIQ